MSQKIFVLGATGLQGGHIATELIKKGHRVTTLSTNPEKVITSTNLEVQLGNLESQDDLSRGLKDVKTAVFTFPLIFDLKKAIAYTNNFIEACKVNQVAFVIFNAGFDLPNATVGQVAMDIKVAIKELFDASNLNVLTLMPDVYVDNLAAPWSIPVIMGQGILPYPVANGTKIPWISHHDLGRYVAAAIEQPTLGGQTLAIGGNLWTGEEIAAAIAAHTKKEIQFVGLKPDDFEQQLLPAFGAVPAREIANLYRYVADNHSRIIQKNFAATQALLSIQPQTLEEWVASVQWEN